MAFTAASQAMQARMTECFSYFQASHGEMHSSPMYPSPPLRIQHQWSSKAALFCSQRSLKATLISYKCSRHSCSPIAMAPSEHLTLVPSKPDEYEKLGSLALCGLPSPYPRFVAEGEMKTKYPIIVAGPNFGCGSSREHAPVALGASGVRAVVAESYARIFFRNSVATGGLFAFARKTGMIASTNA
ncbi:hypothetical protein GOP47_0016415 [Adiantum capillus-veneris]|uniref:Aconitase A/isopropylmalate dehydratase small subunit swivel domain-containing protein n=1 Tax=Adiantum capillus-veneris TaxID=13818 RepID=A0A9D4UHS8_ADICA|nr:hypothetical protein GOP47_0016415 [Adiantum capillus-veneris]